MKKDIIELFIYLDDFCTEYEIFMGQSIISGKQYKKPTRIPSLAISEIMTIIILFQQSPCKNFKYFYLSYLQQYKQEFPHLPSYNRFIELQQRCLGHFHALLLVLCALSQHTGINYIDATCIPVCHNKRTSRHKVFKGLAALGKSTMGWFFGFKLHLVINEKGELLNAQLTPGNVDDRKPVRHMVHRLKGLLFGDKGYIDKILFHELYKNGLKLITGLKKNMENKLMALNEKTLLRKRSVIETVNGVLKTDFQIAHTRHRSFINGFIHIFSTLVAYCFKTKKPCIKFDQLIPN
jgi:hypothetical protein